MNKILRYINPISHLGNKKYSILFPFFVTVILCILSEVHVQVIAQTSEEIGTHVIYLFFTVIIYFAFRDGIRGGVIATIVTLSYYSYIVFQYARSPEEQGALWETIIILGFIYLTLSTLVGWLKQTIDNLIEREANEKRRLQSVVQQLPAGVIITDSNGTIIQANRQSELILGKKIRTGLPVQSILLSMKKQNEKKEVVQWPLLQALTTGRSVIGKEYVLEREDGRRVFVQMSASLIHNKEHKLIAAASIINDITVQREMEERKDDFVNMASHELKTPITSMKLYIDSLLNRIQAQGDEKGVKTLTSIKYQTERLQELVSDLLDVSRLQTGKLGFNKEKFRLDELIIETINELKGFTKQQKIIFKKSPQVQVNADKFRIYQVITNLITNAVKYSPAGSDITITLKKEAQKAIVSVQDLGIGIEKNQQKKIFERLYQVTDPKEKTFPGLGMGLYITKEIVKKHKGTIWVESEKGKGSTFYFSLPLTTQENTKSDKKSTKKKTKSRKRTRSSAYNVA